eukprot:m.122440 g.122440  ORF g.122440 m.122440 type:complete len:316 (+) comp12938_c0_seq26:354-1301(+)
MQVESWRSQRLCLRTSITTHCVANATNHTTNMETAPTATNHVRFNAIFKNDSFSVVSLLMLQTKFIWVHMLLFSDHCSICRLPCRGLMIWCRCGHGGHADHMREWFQTETKCPGGCGHSCELLPPKTQSSAPLSPRTKPSVTPRESGIIGSPTSQKKPVSHAAIASALQKYADKEALEKQTRVVEKKDDPTPRRTRIGSEGTALSGHHGHFNDNASGLFGLKKHQPASHHRTGGGVFGMKKRGMSTSKVETTTTTTHSKSTLTNSTTRRGGPSSSTSSLQHGHQPVHQSQGNNSRRGNATTGRRVTFQPQRRPKE